ncbi:MAG TPA: SusC/RagA family TonB-linked outer membrane protein [Longimicrobiales bacterium]|nr:SusC/RagA family TonB-linked outer membrane protein [Longimicrobiales bacterium]
MRRTFSIVVAALLLVPGMALAQAGTIVGRVTDAQGQPLAAAQISVVGTNRGNLTNEDGRYVIPGIRAGQYQVQATLIGYSQATQQVTVSAGQTAEANFSLSQTAIQLGAVVVTATGQQQTKREMGNSVGVIDTKDVNLAPVNSFSDLVQGRTAGVTVTTSSGTTGGGSRIRIRGSNSVTLSNSPLIVIDGVRVDDNPQSYGLFTGGQQTSRLNDLNPQDIADIQILKGPAASALYGTAAANGVIQITTKRGEAGATRWRAWWEAGQLDNSLNAPDNYYAVDASGNRCDLLARAAGCTIAQTYSYNPLKEYGYYRTGYHQLYGVSASGGSDQVTYYVSGERTNETGVTPDNGMNQTNLRANLNAAPAQSVTLSAKVGFVKNHVQLPQSDNSALGAMLNGLLGRPTPSNIQNNAGFQTWTPSEAEAWKQYQDVSHWTASGTAKWEPLSWLTLNGTAGLDDVSRLDQDYLPPNSIRYLGPPFSIGLRETWNYDITTYTANGNVSANYSLLPSLLSTTSTGVQYNKNRSHNIFAAGNGLTPGTSSLAGASSGFDAGEGTVENVTLGTYVQEQLAWRNNVFLNAAVRGDKNSAFGVDIGWVWYPSVSLAWSLGDESFFPKPSWLSNLRLRTAYGQSGLRPGFRDALQYYAGVTAVTANGLEPGFVISGAGNPSLKPEISREYELGADLGFLDGRVGLELTYYNKKSTDALINRPLAPSLGASTSRFENIGSLQNKGIEVSLDAGLIRSNAVDWQATISGSNNKNELLVLGAGIPPIVGGFGDTQQFRPGYAAGSYFDRPIVSYKDANGDGTIAPSEVVVGDTAAYLGQPFPTRQYSFSTDLTLWHRVRVSGLLDYAGGQKLFDRTMADRCTTTSAVCQARFDPNAPLSDQAAIVAFEQTGTYAGFIVPADYWKLREVSLTLMAPRGWLGDMGLGAVQDLSLTLSGRNLATWTKYPGFDPEVNFDGQSNFTTADYYTLPPARYFTARVNVTF